MSSGLVRTLLGASAGAAGVVAAGTAFGIARHRRVLARRGGDRTPFGSLRSAPVKVAAEDDVLLHVEVDEAESPLTIVFIHGYALTHDCWHFQRAAFRGRMRTVFYDQRSHGRSGRSPLDNATIDQLGVDLRSVLDEVVPEGPVVLVGHSMGGMSIVAFAEQFPDLFGERVVATALISTTAGGLSPARILLPVVPAKLGNPLAHRTIATLARGHRAVDQLLRVGRAVATVFTDVFAFGDEVPSSYVEFVDSMLAATSFEVVAEFFPSFGGLDKFHAVEVLSHVPTTIIGGTADRLTSIGHSRKLHARITGSTLLECEGAGHMVILERHERVNAALDELVAAALDVLEGTRRR